MESPAVASASFRVCESGGELWCLTDLVSIVEHIAACPVTLGYPREVVNKLMGLLKRTGYIGFVAATGGVGALSKWAVMGTEGSRERKKATKATEQLTRQIAQSSGNFELPADADAQYMASRIEWLNRLTREERSFLNPQELALVQLARSHPEDEAAFEQARVILWENRKARRRRTR